MRTVGVVTTSRADYGILRPVLRAIDADPHLALHLIVGGMHLVPAFGTTVERIEADGITIGDRVDMLLAAGSPESTAKSMGLGVIAFAESYVRHRPDLLLALGDRFEMHAAVVAALPLGIPVAHIHGGEVTEGAIDDALRHGISKIAHLHFPATEEAAARLRRMGEEDWRITVAGAPALDNLRDFTPLSPAELARRTGVAWDLAPLLVTFHPVTRELDRLPAQVDALTDALATAERPIVVTAPNADPKTATIVAKLRAFVAGRRDAAWVENFGTEAYFSAMAHAAAMVGNSSSGIIEAASFRLPVVNVGSRQAGRLRGANVVDVERDEDSAAIAAAIARATSSSFRDSLHDLTNPYGDGRSAGRIVARLREVDIDAHLMRKRFADG